MMITTPQATQTQAQEPMMTQPQEPTTQEAKEPKKMKPLPWLMATLRCYNEINALKFTLDITGDADKARVIKIYRDLRAQVMVVMRRAAAFKPQASPYTIAFTATRPPTRDLDELQIGRAHV